MMTATALNSLTSTRRLFRARARNKTTPRRQKRKPAMGAGRPGNKAAVGRWAGKSNRSNVVEPAPAKYSPQTIAPMANVNTAPARISVPLWPDQPIHREHPIANYASEDHGVIRNE